MKRVVIPTTPLTSRTGQLVKRMVIKDIWRLTSNWAEGLKILSMGVISVHPLYEMNQDKSIKSTKSTPSIPIAPETYRNLTGLRLDLE